MYKMIFFYFSLQAAEQAKASPALVAKDPSTSTNKKEEEDLAKGKEATSCLSNERTGEICTLTPLCLYWHCITAYAGWLYCSWSATRVKAGLLWAKMQSHVSVSFCLQLSSCHWRSSVSSHRPPCRACTPAPPPCSPRTSRTAERSAPSTTSRLLRTMSSPSSQERSSPSWTIGEPLHTQNMSTAKKDLANTERVKSRL